MKIGIQLFGVLKDHQGSVMEALRMVRELGYSRVEPCISAAVIPGLDHIIWPADRLEARAEEVRAAGLEMVSCHLFAENPDRELLKRIASFGIR